MSVFKNWVAGTIGAVLVSAACLALFALLSRGCSTIRLVDGRNHVKGYAHALNEYHEQFDAFPPVAVYDDASQPLHSWRMFIEPYLVVSDREQSRYDREQSWDSDWNRSVTVPEFGDYQCLAVIGDRTAWKERGSRNRTEFQDGTSNTVMAIGLRNTGVSYAEPVDLLLGKDGKLRLSKDPSGQPVDTRDVLLYSRTVTCVITQKFPTRSSPDC